jgi:hypothetical protein
LGTTEPRVAYHGTPCIEAVLAEGLRPDSWMALSITEAAHYGDVVEINLTQLEGTWPRAERPEDDFGNGLCWQAHTNEQVIPPSALRRLTADELARAAYKEKLKGLGFGYRWSHSS